MKNYQFFNQNKSCYIVVRK